MQKKKADILTMTNYDRHITTQTDNISGLTRHERQCNQTRTTDREENIESPRFEFLKISANALCTHPATPTVPALQTKVCGKSAILPALD